MSELQDTARRSWKTAVLAGMASYLDAGALVTSGIAIGGYYAGPLQLGAGTIGSLLGLQTLAFAAGALFGGRLGDRYGRRKIFTLSLLLYSVGILLLLAAAGPALLYAGVIATGVAIGADLPVSLALANEEAPEGKKGTMVVFSGMLWLAGIVAVLALSSFMGAQGMAGGRILFAHLLIVAIVVLLLRLTLSESAEWAAARRAADAHTADGHQSIEFTRIRQLFRAPALYALLATGLYYATWNLGANTLGQFGTFLWTNLAKGEVEHFSQLSLLGLPIGFLAGLLFMRVVDTPARHAWFAAGSALLVTAWALPALFGPTKFTLVAVMLISGLGNSFAGESIYKVWSQELFPTLLRATAQGVTMAFTRAIAGLAALATPALALGHARLMFGLLFALMLAAAVIGLAWVPRLSEAPQSGQPTTANKPVLQTTGKATE
ncbi:MFS transporter [Streptomyces caniscabiei]|uniref:MFS transporter n=2 Tax=Streptomyces caniscabiei TaxID=2746961 RepID=A0A927QHX2_9ACTN|nr:MFS transporter [Streptomyces caniscabiei]MBD9726330.1 MFS transporter [Streptomyces caniscabiei]MDX3511817.1 MFS transporter [Streptomyces caniscabiei]MDX3719366.1 MFS transporter [Streptomyces caniscabiei]WEO29495.1 MFS transporter [Streptomyces caniscabiei]